MSKIFKEQKYISLCVIVFFALLQACGGCGETGENTNNKWDFGENNLADGFNNNNDKDDMGKENNESCKKLTPPQGPCDPFCQQDCKFGESCVIRDRIGMTRLRFDCYAEGDTKEGEICDSKRVCEKNLSCLKAEGTQQAKCYQHCRRDVVDHGCPAGYECTSAESGIAEFGVCTEIQCKRFPNDDCPALQNCYRTSNGFECLDYNVEAKSGDSCSVANQCNDAQECVASLTNAEQTCEDLCVVNGPPTQCSDGKKCIQLINEGFGACQESMDQ